MDINVKDLINKNLRAIEYEREEERERHYMEMTYLSGDQREKKGRAINYLKKKLYGRTISGDYLYIFNRTKAIETEISVGDQIIVSTGNPLDITNPSGIVYELNKKSIIISLGRPLKLSGLLRIDLSVNDTTYKRMENALIELKNPSYSKLHTLLSGKFILNSNISDISFKDLNEKQIEGINLSFNTNSYYSIQGPPGTGKTYTAAHLIKEIYKNKKKILITADSNAAVDNIIRHLLKLGIEVLRIGNPIRVNHDLKRYTLDYKIAEIATKLDIASLEEKHKEYKQELSTMDKPKNKDMRGYTYDELYTLMKKNQVSRGISRNALKNMKPFLKLNHKISEIYNQIKEIKEEIKNELIDNAGIIACTNSTSGSDLLLDKTFDFVIIDEAAQASIPSTMIPILKANRFILIGDHFQLPPVVVNSEAKALGLNNSLMNYLYKLYPYFLTRLNHQYRMNQTINDLVSSMFYDGKLISDRSVRNKKILDGNIIDVISVQGNELMNKDSKSFYNLEEIEVVKETVLNLLKENINPSMIGIISPYKAHVKKLREIFEDIEIDTVDAFQGREKEIIIISLVRSNDENNIGFLADYRRLNVSISRSKYKLIIIGNIDMLKNNTLYNNLFEYIEVLNDSSN